MKWTDGCARLALKAFNKRGIRIGQEGRGSKRQVTPTYATQCPLLN